MVNCLIKEGFEKNNSLDRNGLEFWLIDGSQALVELDQLKSIELAG